MPAQGILIGLAGKARSGKDTVGNYLETQHFFHSTAFADRLKEICAEIFDFTEEQLWGDLKEEVDPLVGKSPRFCLQYVGTEIARACWPDVWLWHLEKNVRHWMADGLDMVVTDVRMENEAGLIKDLGGYLIRVDRDQARASNGVPNHSSETALDDWQEWDLVIDNNGSLEELYAQVDRFITALRRAA